mmetsp:Transcript_41474/g.74399  ORF Transcript_41474/g.74399 Transcript_41474/m.74399 type:complete len:227 (+) Transcript_41474:3-683(+)
MGGGVRAGKKVCVANGLADHDWFLETFPGYEHLASFPGGPTVRAEMLREQTCDVATFAKFEYDFLRQLGSVNPNCKMQAIGEPLQSMDAGWMVLNDVKESCTNIVRDVLSVWLLRLDLDGTLDRLLAQALTPIQHCPAILDDARRGISAGQLRFGNMLGILALHGAGVCIALLFHSISGAPKAVAKLRKSTSRMNLRIKSDDSRSTGAPVSAWADDPEREAHEDLQ